MSVISFLFALVALVCFLVSAYVPTWQRFLSFGLASLTLSWITQLMLASHSLVVKQMLGLGVFGVIIVVLVIVFLIKRV